MKDKKTVLVLRTCDRDMKSYCDFQWPRSGWIEAPDWDGGRHVCGGGLHGLPWGMGDGQLLSIASSARWLVVRVNPDDGYVDFSGDKCKFRRGEVIHVGNQISATRYLIDHGADPSKVCWRVAATGDNSRLAGGDCSTMTAGNRSTMTAGERSELTAGAGSELTAGAGSRLTAGEGSRLTAGNNSTLLAGVRSRLTAGDYSVLTAGRGAVLLAGDYSTLRSGDDSTLTGGAGSRLLAGARSTLTGGARAILTASRGSTLVFSNVSGAVTAGVVGKDGIEPETAYILRGKDIVRAPVPQSRDAVRAPVKIS